MRLLAIVLFWCGVYATLLYASYIALINISRNVVVSKVG